MFPAFRAWTPRRKWQRFSGKWARRAVAQMFRQREYEPPDRSHMGMDFDPDRPDAHRTEPDRRDLERFARWGQRAPTPFEVVITRPYRPPLPSRQSTGIGVRRDRLSEG